MNFASTWNNLLKYCISVDFLLMEVYVQVPLRKELHIAPFVEPLKQLLSEGLADEFASTWNKLA